MIYRRPNPIVVTNAIYDPSLPCWKEQALKVAEVKKISTGKGAVVGYIDDGVGCNTELAGAKIERWSFFEKSIPIGDHSTFGATIIAGSNLGIFPDLKIVSKQVIDPDTGVASTMEVASAIKHALDTGIQTINLSMGADGPDPIIEAALSAYVANGINIAVVSAGNDGPGNGTTDWPARYAEKYTGIFSAAATEIDEAGNIKIALFSSRGITTISAPGAALKSMDSKSQVEYIYGTSFSAPIVSAAVAVARTLRSTPLTQKEILAHLYRSSDNAYDREDGGYGNINIVDFLKRCKNKPDTDTIIPAVKKTFWQRLKCVFGC